MLVGSCNNWSAEDAQRTHQFSVSDASRHECTLRLSVPPSGLHFQILSAERHWGWRLSPSGKGSLKRGRDQLLIASLARGPVPDGAQRDFKVRGLGTESMVEVKVSRSLDHGAAVWCVASDGPEEGSPTSELFPGME